MDNDIVLNIAEASSGPVKHRIGSRGGRWTDRCVAGYDKIGEILTSYVE